MSDLFNGNAQFLIVDDSVVARNEVRSVLNKLGFSNVDEAVDGRSAIERLKSMAKDDNPYMIVFLDLNMPGMDGLQTLDAIRADRDIKNTHVVVITTDNSKPTVIAAVMKGISGYIVKPFSTDDIKKKLVEIFHRLETGLHGHN